LLIFIGGLYHETGKNTIAGTEIFGYAGICSSWENQAEKRTLTVSLDDECIFYKKIDKKAESKYNKPLWMPNDEIKKET
jgi:hypothetical protein